MVRRIEKQGRGTHRGGSLAKGRRRARVLATPDEDRLACREVVEIHTR
jgi:hypothetical protein